MTEREAERFVWRFVGAHLETDIAAAQLASNLLQSDRTKVFAALRRVMAIAFAKSRGEP